MRQMKMDVSDIVALVDELENVHKLGIKNVEIRGCELGKYEGLMRLTALFLGARRIRGPKKYLSMGVVQALVYPQFEGFSQKKDNIDPREEVKAERVDRYPLDGLKRFRTMDFAYLYRFEFLPGRKDQVLFASRAKTDTGSFSLLVAESEEALTAFVRRKMGLPRGKAMLKDRDPVLVQYLLGLPPIFPQESSRFLGALAEYSLG
jgi:hypothetical protein